MGVCEVITHFTQPSLQNPQPPPTTMETWPEACFKAYDIRGLANGDGTGELTPDFAYRLGRALATYLECCLLYTSDAADDC